MEIRLCLYEQLWDKEGRKKSYERETGWSAVPGLPLVRWLKSALLSVLSAEENTYVRWVRWNLNDLWAFLLGKVMQLSPGSHSQAPILSSPHCHSVFFLHTIALILMASIFSFVLFSPWHFFPSYFHHENKCKLWHLCFWVSHLLWSLKTSTSRKKSFMHHFLMVLAESHLWKGRSYQELDSSVEISSSNCLVLLNVF